PWLRVVIGLAIVSAILFGMHFYLWVRLVRDTAMPSPWRGIASAGIALLGVTMLGGFPLMRHAPRWLTSAVMWIAYTWMGLAFLTIVLLVVGDLLKLGAWFASREFDAERHRDLARWIAGVAAGGAAALALWGARGARAGAIAINRVRILL